MPVLKETPGFISQLHCRMIMLRAALAARLLGNIGTGHVCRLP